MKDKDKATLVDAEETEFPSPGKEEVKEKGLISKSLVFLTLGLVLSLVLISFALLLADWSMLTCGLYLIYFILSVVFLGKKRSVSIKYGGETKTIVFKPVYIAWSMIAVDLMFSLAFILLVPMGWILFLFLLFKVALMFPIGGKVNALASFGDLDSSSFAEHQRGVIKEQIKWFTDKLETKDRVIEIMKERKLRNCVLILIGQAFCLAGGVVGVLFYWEMNEDGLMDGFDGLFFSEMEESPIFCISMLIVLVLMLLELIYTTFLGTLLISFVSIGTGIFFSLLSTWSLPAFFFMKKLDAEFLIFKCLELLPIPFIAIILVGFGFQTAFVFVRQEECNWKIWRTISTVFTYVILLLVSASLVAVQFWTNFGLQQNWNNETTYHSYWDETHLDPHSAECYVLNSALFSGLTCALAVLMLFSCLAGNLRVPGIYNWICSVIILTLAILSLIALNIQPKCQTYFLENLQPYMLCLGISSWVIGLMIGINGVFIYLPSFFNMLWIIIRALLIPILMVFYVYFLFLGLSLRMVSGEKTTQEHPNITVKVDNNNKVEDDIKDIKTNESTKQDEEASKKIKNKEEMV